MKSQRVRRSFFMHISAKKISPSVVFIKKLSDGNGVVI